MLVERILVSCVMDKQPSRSQISEMLTLFAKETDSSLYKPALEQIKDFIKTSTSSMTAVPKPLKFLRPHYENLETAYTSWPEGENKACATDDACELRWMLTEPEILCRHALCPRHDLF